MYTSTFRSKPMKKHTLLATMTLALVTAYAGAAQADKAADAPVKPAAQQTQAALWASHMLSRYHYKAVPLDDAMSEKIFDRYFKSLDGEKLFFTQADVDAFEKEKTRLDDAIAGENLQAPFAIYN